MLMPPLKLSDDVFDLKLVRSVIKWFKSTVYNGVVALGNARTLTLVLLLVRGQHHRLRAFMEIHFLSVVVEHVYIMQRPHGERAVTSGLVLSRSRGARGRRQWIRTYAF